MTIGHYVLRDRQVVRIDDDDVLAWAREFEACERIVKQEDVGGVRVSTVFLGVPGLSYRQGPPLLFETMVFGGTHDQEQHRCCTWAEAEAQHADIAKLVREGLS